MNILKKIFKKNRKSYGNNRFYPSYVRKAIIARYAVFTITAILVLTFYGTMIYDFIYPNNPFENPFSILGWIAILFFVLSACIDSILQKYCEYKVNKIGEIHPLIAYAIRETLDEKIESSERASRRRP